MTTSIPLVSSSSPSLPLEMSSTSIRLPYCAKPFSPYAISMYRYICSRKSCLKSFGEKGEWDEVSAHIRLASVTGRRPKKCGYSRRFGATRSRRASSRRRARTSRDVATGNATRRVGGHAPGDLSGDFRLAQLLELAALGEARDFALRPHDQGAAAHGTRAGTLTRRDGRDGRAADDDGGSEGGGGH